MSSASSVTVFGLSIMESPCKASPRTTVYMSHLYISTPGVKKIQGSVCHYSEQDGKYSDVGVYYVIMAVKRLLGDYDCNT